jgi:hypothetical protein
MSVRKTLLIGVVGACALMGASCGGSPATSTVTATGPSASGGPSATAAATATTTTTATTLAHVYVFGDEWTTNPVTDAQGSGCTPGATGLPDGVWFGFAEAWSTSQIAFDMACWWTGAKAKEVGLAHGFEDVYDFYITNDNTTVRLVTVAGDIPAKQAGADVGVITLSQVIVDPEGSLPAVAPYPVWIYVNGGVVTELAVQYIP